MTTEKPNGKAHNVVGKTSLQAMNLLAAEVLGTATEVGILSKVDEIDKALPGPSNAIKGLIKNCIIKPLMRPIEWCTQYTKGIEGEKEYQHRISLPEEVRADNMASSAYHYALAMASCYTVMGVVQSALNKATGVPMTGKSQAILLAADAAIHVGAIAIMGSPAAMRNTQTAKQAISCVFKSFGIDEKRANDMANYGVAVQFPNYVTYLADVGLLYAMNKNLAGKGLPHV